MQKSISKRLLAGILSIVMVLSLFMTVPAKSQAGPTNRNLLSIVLGTYTGENLKTTADPNKDVRDDAADPDSTYEAYVPGIFDDTEAGDIGIANTGIKDATGMTPATFAIGDTGYEGVWESGIMKGDQDVTADFYYSAIHNGEYELDAEDWFYVTQTQNTIQFVFTPLHIEDYKDLAGVQVYLGDAASGMYSNGWEEAQWMISGSYLIVNVTTTPIDEAIAPGDIASLRTNCAYQYYFPKTLTGYDELEFNHSALTWKYTTDNGVTFTYPTYPILGSAAAANEWYAVETIISADPGYSFIIPGATSLANSAAMYNADLLAITTARGDDRVFTISDISKDGKTAKLTISKIYPITTAKYIDPNIVGIELSRELNFGTNKVNTVAEAKALMPKKFTVIVTGENGDEKKEVDMTNFFAAGYFKWVILGASGNDLVELDDAARLHKSEYDNTGAIATPAETYYARLVWDDTLWNAYNVRNDDNMGALRVAMFINSLADGHDLLGVYAKDETRVTVASVHEAYAGDEALQPEGWTICFTINGEKNYGGMVSQETGGLTENAAPTIMFNGFGDTWTMTAYGAGTCKSWFATAADAKASPAVWGAALANNTKNPCPAGDQYYKAGLEPITNVYTASPVVYRYFNPAAGLKHEAKQGTVSVTVQDPKVAYNLKEDVEYVVRAATGSMDLKPESENNALDYEHTELYWTGKMKYGNTGHERFKPDTEYVATIAIPVKAGYSLTFTPEVRFNGYVADAVEIQEADGVEYLVAAYTFNKTSKAYHVAKDYVYKMLHITGLGLPYAGGTVPRKLGCSESSARFYEFVDVTWYENGVEYEGETFQLGKRYTAVLTYDCSKFNIKEDCQDKDILATTDKAAVDRCMTSAKITKSSAEFTATFNFPAADEKKLTGVANVNIEVPYGMPVNDFYTYVQAQLFPVATFADGSVGVARLYAVLDQKGTEAKVEGLIKNAFAATYPGILGYNPNKTTAQDFQFTAYAVAGTQKAVFLINIHVKGQQFAVNFDANGGVYAGGTKLAEAGAAYGFKYIPAEIYREGYLFAGWFTAPTGGTRIYAKTIFDGKTTKLYAHWVKVFTGKVWTVNAASYTAGRITVTAGGVKTKVDGYEFSYSADGKTWTTFTQSKGKNTAYITGLQSKKAYFVRVRAYRLDSAGKFVYSGAYSNVKKVVVK